MVSYSDITATIDDHSRIYFVGPEDAFITVFYQVMKCQEFNELFLKFVMTYDRYIHNIRNVPQLLTKLLLQFKAHIHLTIIIRRSKLMTL